MADNSIKKDRDPRCQWKHPGGARCQLRGTISPTTQGNENWYCIWHYDCLKNPPMAIDKHAFGKNFPERWPAEDAENLWLQTLGEERRTFYRKEPSATWDSSDEVLIKGLAAIGEGSMVWKKAPKGCQEAAKNLLHSGWKPKMDIRL